MVYGKVSRIAMLLATIVLLSDGFLLGRRDTVVALVSLVPNAQTTANPSSYNSEAVNQDLLAAFGQSLQDNPPKLSATTTVALPKPTSEGKNLDQTLKDIQREKQIGPTTHGK